MSDGEKNRSTGMIDQENPGVVLSKKILNRHYLACFFF